MFEFLTSLAAITKFKQPMSKIIKKGLIALTLMLGMAFAAPQQANATNGDTVNSTTNTSVEETATKKKMHTVKVELRYDPKIDRYWVLVKHYINGELWYIEIF